MDIEIEGHEYLTFVPGDWEHTGQAPIEWFKENFSRFIFSPQHIVKKSVPYELNDGPNKGGVYFLLDKNKIVYIGVSNSIYRRLVQHFNKKLPFTHYWCFGGMPEMFVEAIESYYIHKFKPSLNEKYPIPHEVVQTYL